MVVRIGIHDYEIKYVPESEVNTAYQQGKRMNGFINFDKKEILINKERDVITQSETMLHEVLHGLMYEWGIQENLDILDETEEKLVNTLGKGLIQVMRQMCFHDIVEDLKSTGG